MTFALTDALSFIIQTSCNIYASILLLRFLLQWTHADFYNPLSQFIVKVTNPILNPMRRLIPIKAGMDFSAILAAYLLITLEIFLVIFLYGVVFQQLGWLIIWGGIGLLALILEIYFFAIFALAILSWFSSGNYNPAVSLMYQLTEPVMSKIRNFLPRMGVVDFSPIIALLIISFIKMLVIHPLLAKYVPLPLNTMITLFK